MEVPWFRRLFVFNAVYHIGYLEAVQAILYEQVLSHLRIHLVLAHYAVMVLMLQSEVFEYISPHTAFHNHGKLYKVSAAIMTYHGFECVMLCESISIASASLKTRAPSHRFCVSACIFRSVSCLCLVSRKHIHSQHTILTDTA